jgi:hypothetical protein
MYSVNVFFEARNSDGFIVYGLPVWVMYVVATLLTEADILHRTYATPAGPAFKFYSDRAVGI